MAAAKNQTEVPVENGIEVVDVSKQFGDFQALSNVNLSVPDGSMTALLGPSGSGKSTLLRAIAGLEVPSEGKIFISGEDQTGKPVRNRNVGFVFQHYAAFKHMTVFDNMGFSMKLAKAPRDVMEREVGRAARILPRATGPRVARSCRSRQRTGGACVPG